MPALFVLFLVIPAVELYLIIQAAHQFGFGNTLGALIVISLVGAWLTRREGARAWMRFNQALAAGRTPSKEIADGVCVLGAGALLMTPGFLSDVFGILLLFPPTRAVLRALLLKRFAGRTGPIRTSFRRGDVFDTTASGPTTEPPRPPDVGIGRGE